MSYRFILALLIFLLAGCATTGKGTVQITQATLETVPDPVPSSTATVDEHLFIPASSATPAVGEVHVYNDVWERLVHSFELEECSDHEVSLKWAQWYADRPEYMARIFKRAQPWIFFITEELERRQLPGELALLPIVESAYDPFAYSSGRAMGTWQFISGTGKQYGLNHNWW